MRDTHYKVNVFGELVILTEKFDQFGRYTVQGGNFC